MLLYKYMCGIVLGDGVGWVFWLFGDLAANRGKKTTMNVIRLSRIFI